MVAVGHRRKRKHHSGYVVTLECDRHERPIRLWTVYDRRRSAAGADFAPDGYGITIPAEPGPRDRGALLSRSPDHDATIFYELRCPVCFPRFGTNTRLTLRRLTEVLPIAETAAARTLPVSRL